ncbi:hypothetical protein F2Q68_00020095 [Brassica cretica]|uniref:Uncharacterized protein n=1 Tax=Brassica cretica TaxID=69181 RepID=A0A8S9FSW9_BRACR|nr:hypothetical protein F2Q68_00020095 [Brassica cretica]
MSSSHGDKRSSDVEMGEATSPAPIPTSPIEAPACVADHLSFREKLVRRQAEKEKARAGAELPSTPALVVAPDHGTEGVTPRDTGTLAGSAVPDASALPAGSSTTPILVEDKGRAADSMPPPPARKEITLPWEYRSQGFSNKYMDLQLIKALAEDYPLSRSSGSHSTLTLVKDSESPLQRTLYARLAS